MRGTLTTWTPDRGETTEELDGPPGLGRLRAAVGGPIQLVPGLDRAPDGRPCVAYCNEEGKLEGLPPNRLAQILWRAASPGHAARYRLVGPVAVVTGDDELMAAL